MCITCPHTPLAASIQFALVCGHVQASCFCVTCNSRLRPKVRGIPSAQQVSTPQPCPHRPAGQYTNTAWQVADEIAKVSA